MADSMATALPFLHYGTPPSRTYLLTEWMRLPLWNIRAQELSELVGLPSQDPI